MLKKLLVIAAFVVVGYLVWQTVLAKNNQGGTVTIPKGTSVDVIATALTERHIISSRILFKGLAFISGAAAKLQAGEYVVPKQSSILDVLRMLRTGKSSTQEKSLTIPEGWTIRDIAAYGEKHGVPAVDVYAFAGKPPSKTHRAKPAATFWAREFGFLTEKPADAPLEGFLFPDTYRVYNDATAEDVIRIMLKNFGNKYTSQLQDAVRNAGHPFYDILTVASIVEAEVPHPDDRPIVAGIIWKRLRMGVALQVDATLNYSIDGSKPSLTADDVKINSPYNTYKYRGLPPTPINNPGIEALQAAIHPKESPYLYWLSTKDGTTIFSKTLDEHNTAKARYLK